MEQTKGILIILDKTLIHNTINKSNNKRRYELPYLV